MACLNSLKKLLGSFHPPENLGNCGCEKHVNPNRSLDVAIPNMISHTLYKMSKQKQKQPPILITTSWKLEVVLTGISQDFLQMLNVICVFSPSRIFLSGRSLITVANHLVTKLKGSIVSTYGEKKLAS